MIHLTFFIRKLSCSISGSCIYYCRRHDFHIARLTCFVQEEIDESTLQLCTFTFINREASSGDFYTEIEIDEVIFFCQFPMRKSIFGKLSLHTAYFFHYIIFGSYTFGNFIIGHIRNRIQQILKFCCSICHSSI